MKTSHWARNKMMKLSPDGRGLRPSQPTKQQRINPTSLLTTPRLFYQHA